MAMIKLNCRNEWKHNSSARHLVVAQYMMVFPSSLSFTKQFSSFFFPLLDPQPGLAVQAVWCYLHFTDEEVEALRY